MRTIPATFDTKDEADTAIRRLQAIGVTPDRIVLKEMEETGGASQPDVPPQSNGRPARAFFVTAKVSPEQIGAATEILKGFRPDDTPPPLPLDAGGRSSAPFTPPQSPEAATEAATPHQAGARVASGEIHQTGAGSDPNEGFGGLAPQHQPRRSDSSKADWRRWAQYGIIYCLLMVAAFTGGWLIGSVF